MYPPRFDEGLVVSIGANGPGIQQFALQHLGHCSKRQLQSPYIEKDSKQHWVDEIALNTNGVPGRPHEPEKKNSIQVIAQQHQNANLTNGNHVKQKKKDNA